MRGPDDVGEMEQPLAGGKVLGVGVFRPEALEGDLVLGLLARAARLHDLVRLAVLSHLGFAKLEAEAATVHRPNVAEKKKLPKLSPTSYFQ